MGSLGWLIHVHQHIGPVSRMFFLQTVCFFFASHHNLTLSRHVLLSFCTLGEIEQYSLTSLLLFTLSISSPSPPCYLEHVHVDTICSPSPYCCDERRLHRRARQPRQISSTAPTQNSSHLRHAHL